MSSDALIVLTTVGYLGGAADTCGVAKYESNAASSGIALAITKGKYGEPAEAYMLLNNARQQGAADAAAHKIDCTQVAEKLRRLANNVLSH